MNYLFDIGGSPYNLENIFRRDHQESVTMCSASDAENMSIRRTPQDHCCTKRILLETVFGSIQEMIMISIGSYTGIDIEVPISTDSKLMVWVGARATENQNCRKIATTRTAIQKKYTRQRLIRPPEATWRTQKNVTLKP